MLAAAGVTLFALRGHRMWIDLGATGCGRSTGCWEAGTAEAAVPVRCASADCKTLHSKVFWLRAGTSSSASACGFR